MTDVRPHVVVVGGGITGLATAWFLRDRVRVTVLEADDRLGGKIRTSSLAGVPVEEGPDTFLARVPNARALAVAVGLGDELVEPATAKAFVWSRGRLRPLPKGQVLGVPVELGPLVRSGVLPPAAVIRAGLDLVLPRSRPGLSTDPTVAEVIGTRMGRGVVDRLVEPLVGGINGGRADDLSLSATAPQLAEAAATSRSLILGLRRRRRAPATGASSTGPSADTPGEPVTEKGAGAPSSVTSSASAGPLSEPVTEKGAGAPSSVTSSASASPLSEPVTEKGARAPSSVTSSASAGPGPVFLGVAGGLGRLVERLATVLRQVGVDIRTGVAATGIEPDGAGGYRVLTADGPVEAAAVVVTVPAFAAAPLLRGTAPAVADDLERIRYASVAVATLAYRPADLPSPLDGAGFLVPRVERRLMTACTWTTSKWPALAAGGLVLVRASAGRSGDDRPADLDDAELVDHLHRELSAVMGVRQPPVGSLVSRWPDGFPQYQPGHQRRVDRIEDALATSMPGVTLAGAAYRGLGIAACVRQAQEAAARITARLIPPA
ncbi:MAG TPA: protoporphyrinogen oxidase [Acidimicrobiales bacterium]|nr:protoporphyrinogen oxidase [Acidimicrobiales bacterium]